MNIYKLITFGITGLAMAGLAACSGNSGNILDTIPADASAVIMVNAEKLCAESGITFSSDGPVYADGIREALPESVERSVQMASRLDSHGLADMEKVAVVADKNGNSFVTFAINEFESFREATDITWGDNEEGMHVGTTQDGVSVVASDAQVWITDVSSGAAGEVKNLLEKSRSNSIGALENLASLLSADNMINAVVLRYPDKAPATKETSLQAEWITGTMNVADGSEIIVEATVVKGDGAPVAVKGMQPFNQALLAYIPANPMLAAGAGLTSDFDWSFLGKMAMLTGNFQLQAAISMAIPYLSAIDGSVMLGVTPLTADALDNPDPSNMAVTLMANMPQEKVNELTGMVRNLCFTNGIPTTTDPRTGILTIDSFGLRAYVGNVDGCFAMSTQPFSTGNDNSLAPVFTGKNGAAVLSLPTLRLIDRNCPDWGLDMKLQVESERSVLKITLPRAPKPVLGAIITAVKG